MEVNREYDWYEDCDGHPLEDLFLKACDNLDVWSEPSIQWGRGGDWFRDKDTDGTVYWCDFEEEVDFMNGLTNEYVLSLISDEEVVKKIEEFIKGHLYTDPDRDDYDDEQKDFDDLYDYLSTIPSIRYALDDRDDEERTLSVWCKDEEHEEEIIEEVNKKACELGYETEWDEGDEPFTLLIWY